MYEIKSLKFRPYAPSRSKWSKVASRRDYIFPSLYERGIYVANEVLNYATRNRMLTTMCNIAHHSPRYKKAAVKQMMARYAKRQKQR